MSLSDRLRDGRNIAIGLAALAATGPAMNASEAAFNRFFYGNDSKIEYVANAEAGEAEASTGRSVNDILHQNYFTKISTESLKSGRQGNFAVILYQNDAGNSLSTRLAEVMANYAANTKSNLSFYKIEYDTKVLSKTYAELGFKGMPGVIFYKEGRLLNELYIKGGPENGYSLDKWMSWLNTNINKYYSEK